MYPWDQFFREKVVKILTEKKYIIDIGGGLRVSKKQGNRFDKERSWISPFLEKVDYKIVDPVSDFAPDIVGDIHALPFKDNTQEAIICLAVLEHVENPFKAVSEIYRTLKIDGFCFVYVPFLYYYHAEKNYYKDYWRFSKDALSLLFKDFSHIEIAPVRGALQTWIRLSPLGRYGLIEKFFYFLDKLTGKFKSNQVSGYYIFLVK